MNYAMLFPAVILQEFVQIVLTIIVTGKIIIEGGYNRLNGGY